MFRALLSRLPSRCDVCRAWPADAVCEACVTRFAQPQSRCRSCALPTPPAVTRCGACISTPPPLDQCLAAVSYAYPWSELIIRYKFHGQPGMAQSLALLLRSTPWVEPALEHADLVIPMPLSTERLKERGFNQALLLARLLSPDKVADQLLLRIQDTPPQSRLKRAERERNVAVAFAVDPLKQSLLKDRRVILIDDVMTSGASLFASARALRAAGAAHITGLVVARTDAD